MIVVVQQWTTRTFNQHNDWTTQCSHRFTTTLRVEYSSTNKRHCEWTNTGRSKSSVLKRLFDTWIDVKLKTNLVKGTWWTKAKLTHQINEINSRQKNFIWRFSSIWDWFAASSGLWALCKSCDTLSINSNTKCPLHRFVPFGWIEVYCNFLSLSERCVHATECHCSVDHHYNLCKAWSSCRDWRKWSSDVMMPRRCLSVLFSFMKHWQCKQSFTSCWCCCIVLYFQSSKPIPRF